jgi:MFS family permease
MWRSGFFFHEMAVGLLTVFIPLYVVSFKDTNILGGPLLALGVMSSIAIFCSIPASFLWGYLCDATRHYKIFILLSFASIAIILFLMSLPFAQNLIYFVVLYVVMQVLHVAHEPPKNVLVTEHYTRADWEKSFGFYEAITELGFISGLVIGLFAFALSSSFSSTYTFWLCSALSVAALVLSVLLVADPILIFERRLVKIEKKLEYTHRGVEASSRLMDGLRWRGSLKKDSFRGFALAIVMFALATSLFFTPLPVFLHQGLHLPTSMVYVAYILNSIGATTGYFFIRGRAQSMDIKRQMPGVVLVRTLLIFTLAAVIWLAFSPAVTTGILLIFIGFTYAMYYIMMLSLSMEIIPIGKSGFFDGLVGLGSGIGAFLGPFLAHNLNYIPAFLITAIIFLAVFLTLKLFH